MSENSQLQKALAHSISEVLQAMVLGKIVRENNSALVEDKLQKPRYNHSNQCSQFANAKLTQDEGLCSTGSIQGENTIDITEVEIKLCALTIVCTFLNPCE
ncbi:hypothetical protein PAXRUDRAFT_161069 [Paxillus rubicundulus Ve08.2h10]|uniref:Uncharacterized protein n=1 Tax=Paxillus rubicundulus Ve08.2h10 TaxID=930991 RepID=A0A0D0C9I3_9AGAM|nr:hypothetical protein PAXRUDRAFT_161069 [Paxillus rubicundulus Ve08.2h10]